jgi:5-methylcytosine-specific restriction endonuclease McrA
MEEEKEFKEFSNFDPTKNLSLAPQRRTKRGLGARPLLESEIRDIQRKARSASEAAKLLGVSYNTYKKYAKEYGIFEDLKNPTGIGIRKGSQSSQGYHSLDDIIAGKYPNYPVWKLKRRLLLSGYMEEKCCNCGFEERRITDHRVPLVLDFIDENKKNHKYDNLRMLCFNCSFLIRGNLTGPKKEYEY